MCLLADSIDVDAEIARLGKELDYALGFKASVEKKLSNERFVNNAPAAVVETEKAQACRCRFQDRIAQGFDCGTESLIASV